MRKIKINLFVKVLLAIAAGALLGIVAPDFLVRLLKTFNVLFSQLLKFIVPLLVLGLVTPAIANVGRNAGKMLLTVMVVAYISTICAGFFSQAISSSIFPMYLSKGELSADIVKAKEFAPFIELKIPPICDILTALMLSFMIGVGIIFTGASALKKGFDEFGNIVKITIEKVIIPLLPWYIFSMICEMSAKGVIAHRNPFKCLAAMLPAYFTAFSICSSSAVIPVTSECSRKMGVGDDIVDFTIPLCSTVHMCGSTIKLAVTATAIAFISGMPIPFAVYANFVLLQGIAAVAAPGVMGGVLMASVGLLESVMGFSPEQTALVMTIYLALDGYGPAANVTGDGAITLVIDRFFGRKV